MKKKTAKKTTAKAIKVKSPVILKRAFNEYVEKSETLSSLTDKMRIAIGLKTISEKQALQIWETYLKAAITDKFKHLAKQKRKGGKGSKLSHVVGTYRRRFVKDICGVKKAKSAKGNKISIDLDSKTWDTAIYDLLQQATAAHGKDKVAELVLLVEEKVLKLNK